MLQCNIPLAHGSIEFWQRQLYRTPKKTQIDVKQATQQVLDGVEELLLVWGKHQSQLNALHQLNDSVTLCIILEIEDNGNPKQSWQSPSYTVDRKHSAASFRLIMNTDCQTCSRNFDCPLLQSWLKGRAVVGDSWNQCGRRGGGGGGACWNRRWYRAIVITTMHMCGHWQTCKISTADCCWRE